MKILLIGHACGPGLGSEPGFTWNWAWQLSEANEVWVVTHPERRAEVESYLNNHPRPNLHFEWVVPRTFLDPWKPGRGERGIRIHYLLWISAAYKKARLLHHGVHFDLAHHVSWGTISAAPPFWKLSIPCVWGPVGGAQTSPEAFLKYYRTPWAERLRSLHIRSLRFSLKLRKAAKTAKLVFTTNIETARFLKSLGAKDVRPLLDGGLPIEYVSSQFPPRSESSDLRLLWAGRLESRKGLELVLRALSLTVAANIRLTVAGKGILQPELEALSQKLDLGNKVEFLGAVPYDQMPSLFRNCDALVFSSLRDSFGSVVLEAMAQGQAIIMLNHQGVGTFVPDEAAFKVPVSSPTQTIEALAKSIDECAQSPTLLRSKQTAAWRFAQQQTWATRAKLMQELYQEVLGTTGSTATEAHKEVLAQ